jgi:hypothetical protein
MKVANLIDITPEEIAELEKMGYVGMNVNLATGRIDLVKAEDYEEEENCCGCDCCCCDECEEIEDYTINDVIAEGLRALGITR